MIVQRIRALRSRVAFAASALVVLGSCSSESVAPSASMVGADEPGTMTGELAVYIATFENGTNETRYFLRDNQGEERRLRFQSAPEIEPGARLRVWGSAKGDDFDVDRYLATPTTEGEGVGTAASSLIGVPAQPPRVMCVAQVVMNGGVPSAKLSIEQVDQQFHVGPTSVNAYYQENSYGKNSLGGKTYGPAPYTMSTCDTSGLAKAVKAQLAANGVTGCNQYSFVMTPKVTACAWAGLGQVGTSDKPATDTWYNDTLGCTATVQEPGHNYGMQHSSSITCTGAPFLDDPTPCTHGEYGDKFDTMGGGCRHMNAWQKLYQKWWGGCNAIRVKSSGTFDIYPTETPCNGVQAIQVVFPNGKTRSWQQTTLTSYYLEYRASVGFDQGMTPQVLLHTGAEPVLPTQTNPKGVKVWIINASGDANNPGLVPGVKYTDPAGGLEIAVKSIDTTKAVVEITYSGTTTTTDAGPAGEAGTTEGGAPQPDAGGPVPPPAEPVICLDGMNTVFVAPGPSECVPIAPPVNPDGGGIVIIDAGTATDAGAPRPDATPPPPPSADASSVVDAGSKVDVVTTIDAATPTPDAGSTTPPAPPSDDKGCGCRLEQRGASGGAPVSLAAILALAAVARIGRRRRSMRATR